MNKIEKLSKNDVKAEELEKLGRTVEEINELIETIEKYAKTCGNIRYITPSIYEGDGRIFVNIDTKYNLAAVAYNLSEKTGLKYRTNKRYGSIALLL